MRRSLPSLSRLFPALLLTFVSTAIILKSFSRSGHSGMCEGGNQCSIAEEFTRPPSRQEFASLEHKIKLLSEDIEKLKQQEPPPPKERTPEELKWESRRTECGEGVVRNIDYHHV